MRAAVILGPLEQVVRAGLVEAAPFEVDLVDLDAPLQQIYADAAKGRVIGVITDVEALEAMRLESVPVVSVGISSSTLTVIVLAGRTRRLYLNPSPEAIFSAVLELSGWGAS